jgi:hypothetical protein
MEFRWTRASAIHPNDARQRFSRRNDHHIEDPAMSEDSINTDDHDSKIKLIQHRKTLCPFLFEQICTHGYVAGKSAPAQIQEIIQAFFTDASAEVPWAAELLDVYARLTRTDNDRVHGTRVLWFVTNLLMEADLAPRNFLRIDRWIGLMVYGLGWGEVYIQPTKINGRVHVRGTRRCEQDLHVVIRVDLQPAKRFHPMLWTTQNDISGFLARWEFEGF